MRLAILLSCLAAGQRWDLVDGRIVKTVRENMDEIDQLRRGGEEMFLKGNTLAKEAVEQASRVFRKGRQSVAGVLPPLMQDASTVRSRAGAQEQPTAQTACLHCSP